MSTAIELQKKTSQRIVAQVEHLTETSKGVTTHMEQLKAVSEGVKSQVVDMEERLKQLWKEGLEAQKASTYFFYFVFD